MRAHQPTHFLRLSVLAGLAFGLLGGCGVFCPPPFKCLSQGAVVIRVIDAETRAPVPEVTVSAVSGSEAPVEAGPCPFQDTADGGANGCYALPNPGKYAITVRAAGYADAALEVEAQRDVCNHLTSQVREVALRKAGSTQRALVGSSEACGG
jgi:hypothetical protein